MSLLALVTCGVLASAAPAQPPNIVLIVADDLGWTDLSGGRTNGGHGSGYYRTPNIDALAASGMSFDNAYAQPNCAPARAALMTGLHAARTGVYTVESPNRGRAETRVLDGAPNTTALAPSFVTLAETLRAAGYATGHFGKWHLGDDPEHGPTAHGFDVNIAGTRSGSPPRRGARGHFSTHRGTWPVPGLDGPEDAEGVAYLADVLTDHAIAWMAECAGEAPFFCQLAHFAVHTPIQARGDDIASFEERPDDARHGNRTYAGMLKNLDDNVGRIVHFLETTADRREPSRRLIENTVLVFYSDNGGVGGYADAGIEGGQEITHNAPLRAGKGSLYEGGIRVPLIVRWDGRIRAGAIRSTPIAAVDLYPTLAGLADAPLRHQVDGVDCCDVLLGRTERLPRDELFWHFPAYLQASGRLGTWRTTPTSVIRRGGHKLMFSYETRGWQLFDLESDPGESNDLSDERPDLVATLGTRLRDWLERTDAAMPRTKGTDEPVPLPEVPTVSESGMRLPNILLVLVDDMGFGDMGCTGSEAVHTPHLDDLAASGVLCTRAYVASAVCSPSRAGLITGRDPRRFGYEGNLNESADRYATRPELLGLPTSEHTIGDHLRSAGYATALVGKWHLGTSKRFHPNRRGFDYFCGMLYGSHDYFPDPDANGLERNGAPLREFSSPYLTDFFTDEAIGWISQRHEQQPDRPWFLYLSYNAPHSPMQATRADLDACAHIENEARRTYAAMMRALDRGIGRISTELAELGQREHTLVVFLSDNGGATNNASWNGPLSGAKGSLREGGVRIPMIWSWPGRLPAGATHDGVISSLDLLPTFLAAAGARALELGEAPSHEDRGNRRRGIERFGAYDGIDLLPQLGGSAAPPRTLYWRLQGQAGILTGSWKAVRLSHRVPQLFVPGEDPGERADRATRDHEQLATMLAELAAWEALLPTVPLWDSSPRWSAESARIYDTWSPRPEPR